ncbi:hypothetical protein MSAN_00460000 [Mycena sanguinolenta]|uniref:Uncharacterized protein n=1 Tax=Mycena sanguinolenta TaxID=230812 RepID=A0A8H6ZAW3_9AGAR|nr:hypothetical protein MSAN_00460000 [Mycena sanguinolenta]
MSAFETLDQLYIAILSSAPRQSQLIQILCAVVHFQLTVGDIDQLFGLEEGETRLLLRALHSVLNVPPDDKDKIFSHHASFVEFLGNLDRSSNFCVGTLDCQRSLALSLLQFYAGPFERSELHVFRHLISFIVSLPPSAELFPLIGSINPEYIFDGAANLYNGELASIASWLKKSPSTPTDVIQLWEDYVFIFDLFIEGRLPKGLSVRHVVSPSPELVRVLVSLQVLFHPLEKLPATLDLTWTDLRTTLCSLRPKLVGDIHALPICQPQAAHSWAARDLALHLIRKMVKNHIDTKVNSVAAPHAVLLYSGHSFFSTLEAYTRSQYDLGRDISLLVRLSPPCLVLYRELWSIPPSVIWSSRPSGYKLIHHVSKWLESFPDSTMELITFWKQAADPAPWHLSPFNTGPIFWEDQWCLRVKDYNAMIARLHLPSNLRFPL